MKRLFVLAILFTLLTPIQAWAHQPVLLLVGDTSAAKGPLLVDGTISFALRASFTKAGEKRGFRANFKLGDQLAIQYLIVDKKPENSLKSSQMPTLVVTSPAGKKFTLKLNERIKFFEPYGGTNYLYLGRYSAPAESGTYSFLLTSRVKSAVTLAVGEREILGEVLRGALPTPTPMPGYSATQVSANKSAASCWTIIDGYVYNLTSWISAHPGGSGAINLLCGIDGTNYYKSQHEGQGKPAQRLSGFLLGPLKP